MNIDWLYEEISEFKKSIVRQVLNLKLSKLETLEALERLDVVNYESWRNPLGRAWQDIFKKQLEEKYPERQWFGIDTRINCEDRYLDQSWLSELEQLTWSIEEEDLTDETMLTILTESYTKEEFKLSYGELLDWIYNKAINEGKIGYNNDW
jgi:hypothetical protein